MNTLAKILLLLTYPLVVLARIANAVTGADPLRLKPDDSARSFWIERHIEPARTSYFSEGSEVEGRNKTGAGRAVTASLSLVARLFAPAKPGEDGAVGKPAMDREQDIPDEVYTLW